MWPRTTHHREIVTITCNPQAITCNWIKHTNNKNVPLVLRAHQQFNCMHLELEELNICNPTRITQWIKNFITNNRIHQPIICVAVIGPQCHEQLIEHPNATPTLNQFLLPDYKHWQWQYRFLHQIDNDACVFYLCGLPYSLITQYNLVAMQTGFRLHTLTTQRMALLCLYRFMYGNAFRHTQLGIHLMQRKNNIEKLFSLDTLGRILKIPHTIACDRQKEALNLLVACGLFVAEQEGDEAS